jgi:hypothetical protein
VLRHSHDIDLLVCSQNMSAAATALLNAGFASSTNQGAHDEQRFDHESGLPVELHDRLYRTPLYDGDLTAVWSRARSNEIVGVPVQLIGDADLLVHALVHASLVPQRRGLSWIVDVVSLLQKRDSEGAAIDWAALTRIAGNTHTMLPLFVTCRYLKATFAAPIPQQVIDELQCSAAKAGPSQHLVALDGLRSEPRHRRIKTILDASGWRSRGAITRAMLLPPRAYLKAIHPGIRALPMALLYLTRPLRFVGRQARRYQNRLHRHARQAAEAVTAILPGVFPRPQRGSLK